jgi:hypothetical protein
VPRCAEALTFAWHDLYFMGVLGFAGFLTADQRLSCPCRIRSLASELTTRFLGEERVPGPARGCFRRAGSRFGPSVANEARARRRRVISASLSAMIDSTTVSLSYHAFG